MNNNEIENLLSREKFLQYKKLVRKIKTLYKKGEIKKAEENEKELIIFKQENGIFEIEINRKINSIQEEYLRLKTDISITDDIKKKRLDTIKNALTKIQPYIKVIVCKHCNRKNLIPKITTMYNCKACNKPLV